MHQNYFVALYKLIKRSEKYRTRSECKFGSKWTERSERSLKPCSMYSTVLSVLHGVRKLYKLGLTKVLFTLATKCRRVTKCH